MSIANATRPARIRLSSASGPFGASFSVFS